MIMGGRVTGMIGKDRSDQVCKQHLSNLTKLIGKKHIMIGFQIYIKLQVARSKDKQELQ